ncbi:MAG: phosphodiester glycosidase family protein [Clostridia bacterium]|nr:phosphodiester glycosidase family protein [Clostridia bacterium]
MNTSGNNLPNGEERVRFSSVTRSGSAPSGSFRRRSVLPPRPARKEKKDHPIARVIGRTLVILLTLIVILVGGLLSVCATIAHGPSTTMRDQLVLSAMQASATKWVPGLFLDQETVDAIVDASHVTVPDVIPLDQYSEYKKGQVGGEETSDEPDWSQAHDGILYFTVNGPSYKAYIMLVKDPSRVFVGVAQFQSGAGIRIFDAVEKYSTADAPVVAGINAGEYVDNGGQGTGDLPIGITFSCGKEVWYDGIVTHTFFGFDRDNKLIVKEGMTRAEAEALGIRDGVSFQWDNTLIQNDGTNVKTFYAPDNIARAQRTAIGQRADGTVILLTTDGRSASSLGATRNDVIDLMIRYGAVTAGLLDGGSSAMMYYRDYWDVLGIDYNSLDDYQKMGLVNKYKAFTPPRKMPSYFLVSASH